MDEAERSLEGCDAGQTTFQAPAARGIPELIVPRRDEHGHEQEQEHNTRTSVNAPNTDRGLGAAGRAGCALGPGPSVANLCTLFDDQSWQVRGNGTGRRLGHLPEQVFTLVHVQYGTVLHQARTKLHMDYTHPSCPLSPAFTPPNHKVI